MMAMRLEDFIIAKIGFFYDFAVKKAHYEIGKLQISQCAIL
jgi:hypothetical protein